MKVLKLIITSMICLLCISIHAQKKYDYVWLSGGFENGSEGRQYFTLDFTKPINNRFTNYTDLLDVWVAHTNSSISNSNGKLAFATNGCAILGQDLQIIAEDFDNEVDDFDCNKGYPVKGSALLLPHITDTTLFHFINIRLAWGNPSLLVFNKHLKHALLESTPTGLQLVKINNEIIVEDTLANPVTAVKHGNGRDWWVFTQKLGGNFYRSLLTPNGFEPAQYQEIGPYYKPFEHGIYMTEGQMCFSPNGKHKERKL
ncbi:MAG: hypothetical protein ABIV51_14165 [Saprospiraceae bacterium]